MAVILYSSNVQLPGNFIASYATIQEAVNAAVDGNSLFIQSGTYTENVLINKAITVLGANTGISGTGTRAFAEATINGTVTVSDDVTIDGVQILNSSDNSTAFVGLRVTGDVDVTVTNSRFFSTGPNGNNEDRAILLDTSAVGNITITNNYIGGDAAAKYSTGSWHRGIWSDGAADQLTITGNTFEYNRTAMNLDGYDDNAVTVSGNSIATSGSGVSIGTPLGNEITGITGNTFTDVDTDFNLQNVTLGVSFDLDATNNTGGGSGAAAAIVVLGSQASDTLTGSDGADGLFGNGGADTLIGGLGDDTINGGGGSDTVVLSGTIAGHDFSDLEISGGQITGGTIVGPDGTDTIVGVEALNIGGTFYVLPGMSIQAAINAAPDGATIIVAAGTYTEQLTVDGRSGLTIMADAVAEVIVKAPASLAVNGTSVHYGDAVRAVIAVTDSDSISITGIEVDGSFAGDTTSGSNGDELTGVAYLASSGSIDDVEIYNVSNSQGGGLFGLQHGSGLFIDGKGAASTPAVSVTDSTISNFQKTGALVIGVELTFTGNTVTGIGGTGLTAQNGLQVAQSTGTISGNTITEFGYVVPNGGTYYYSSGIIAYEPSDALGITGNTIIGAATGESAGLDLSDTQGNLVTVDGNTFSTLEYGVYAYTFTGGALGLDSATITNNTFANISIEGLHFAPEESYGAPFTTANGFTVAGTQFDDLLAGSAGSDDLSGLDGDDTLQGNGGNDTLDGGNGVDTAVFAANLADATVVTVTDPVTGRVVGFTSVTTAGEGTDTVLNVEAIEFADATLDLADPVQLFDAAGDLVATFDSIQAAINAADVDATIRVAAGTYDEDVTVNKAVTILGPNEGVTGTDARGAEAIIDGAVTVTAAATLDGLQFLNSSDNATRFDSVTVSTSGDVTIVNSVFFSANPNGNFVGIGDTAIFLVAAATGKMTITDNYITGASQAAFSTASWARGIWSDGKSSDLVISNNTIEYTRSAMNLDSYDDTKTAVSGNLIEFSGSGISMGIPVSTEITKITNNTFTDVGDEFNFQNVTTPLSFDAGATNNVAVTGVTAAQLSILAGGSSDVITGTDGADRIIGNNGNDVLTGGLGDDTIEAGGGSDVLVLSGDFADQDFTGLTVTNGVVSGTVVGPDGSDTVSGIEVLNVEGTYYVLAGMSIQAAVNAASDGDTIVVAAGTYREQVLVDGKELTITADGDVTIEAPDNASIVSSGGFNSLLTGINGADVTISGIDFDGRAQGNGFATQTFAAIALSNSDGNISGGSIAGFTDATLSGAQHGYGIILRGTGTAREVEVSNMDISGFQKNGIDARGLGLDVNLQGNTITGAGGTALIAQNGIVLVTGTTGVIDGNTISALGYAASNASAAGVLLFGAGDGVAVTGNTFNMAAGTNGNAIDLFNTNAGTVTGNEISDANIGIRQNGTFTTALTTAGDNTYTDVVTNFTFDVADASATAFTVNGTDGDDVLDAGAGTDTLSGGDGDDLLFGGNANDTLAGGSGTDTAVYNGNSSDYSFTVETDSSGRATSFTSVTDNNAADGDEGADTLTSVELLQFANATVDLGAAIQVFDDGGLLVGTFNTIQAALGASNDGYTIDIGAGTFVETGLMNVNFDVTIKGAGQGQTIIVSAGAPAGSETRMMQINSEGVSISGLTFAGWEAVPTAATVGRGYHVWAANADDLTISDVEFASNDNRVALYAPNAENLTVTDSYFHGEFLRATIRGAGENMNISNNVFEISNYESGALSVENTSAVSGTFSNNTITHAAGVSPIPSGFGQFSGGGEALTTVYIPGSIVTSDGIVISGNEMTFVNADELNVLDGSTPRPKAVDFDENEAGGPITVTGNTFANYGYQAPPPSVPDVVDSGLVDRGNVLDFNGASDSLAFTLAESIGDEGTMSMWIKLDADAVGRRNMLIEGPDNSGIEFQFRSNGGGQLYMSPNGAEGQFTISSGGLATTVQDWTNVQYTWKKTGPTTGEIHIYVNGVELAYLSAAFDSSIAWTNVVETTGGAFLLGTDQSSTDRWFKGMMDDVALFGSALSTTELNDVRNGDISTTLQPSLVAHWDFEGAEPLAGAGGTTIALEVLEATAADPDVVSVVGGDAPVIVDDNIYTTVDGVLKSNLVGSSDDDTLTGTIGNDTLQGAGGNDTIDGGDGDDTAVFSGNWADYTIDGTGQQITDNRAVPADGSDTTTNIEFFQFANVLATAAEIENDAPMGVDDVLNAGGTVNVLTNDTDADATLGDTKTVTGARAGAESATAPLTSVSAATVIQGTYGSLTINPDGSTSYAFDPALAASIALADGETATDSFTYEVTDIKGLADLAQIDVTVNGLNEEPIGVNDTNATTEGTDATGNVLTNDTDADGDTLVVTSVNQDVGAVGDAVTGKYGTLTFNEDGTYTYVTNDVLGEGDTGTDTFTYTLSDSRGGSDAYAISFDNYDLGPLANGENGWQITNPAFDQDVVTDSDGQALQFTRQVTSGGFGDQLFSPALGQTAGEEGVTGSFEASFSVNPNALQPGATGSYIGVSMDNGTGARGNLLRLETDADGNWHLYAFDFDIDTQTFPQIDLGILPVGQDTKIGFTQVFNPGSGNDVWTVYVNDEQVYVGEGWEDYFSLPGEPTPSPVIYDRLLFRASGNAAAGDLGILIDDVSVTTNQQATLTIDVTGTNDTATITGTVIGDVTEDADLVATGTLSVADADDGEAVFAAASGTTTYGDFAITADGDWTFNLDNANAVVQALAAGETLSDSFEVESLDGTATETVTITITGTNDAPTIEAGTEASGAVAEDADLTTLSDTGTIVFDDIDLADGHTVSVAADSNNTLPGTLVATISDAATGAGTGTVGWTYQLANSAAQTLSQNDVVTESFTVTIDDGKGGTVDQVVTITVTGTDDLAIVSGPSDASGSATETGTLNNIAAADQTSNNRLEPVINYDTLVSGLLAANPDDMPAVLAGVQSALPAGSGLPEAIAVVWDYLDDNFSYYNTAITEAFARLAVEYAIYVKDGGAPLTGIAAKFAPDNGDADSIPQRSQSLHDNLLGNLFDAGLRDKLLGAGLGSNPNPDPVAYDQILQLLADNGLSALLTRPTYDGNQGSVNNALAFDQANGLVPLTGGQLAATDVDAGSVITWTGSAEGTYGSFVIDSDGTWSYTLNNLDPDTQGLAAGEVVTEVFTTTVSDGQGATKTQDVTITITGTNDAPTGAATVSLANGTEDVAYTVSAADLLTGFSDVDGDTLSVSGLAASGGGQVVDNGDGTYTITMPANFNGAVTLSYNVIDGNGGFVTGSRSYTVDAVNDAPAISGGPATATYAEPTDNLGGALDVPALTGTLTVSDVDTSDTVTGSVQGDAVILINGAAPVGTQALAAASALNGAGLLSFTPAMPNGGSASLGWSYDPGNVNLDFLNPGDSLTVTYQVKADDGKDLSTSTETVVITITGTAETQEGTPDDDTLTGNNVLADDLSGLEGDDILDGRSGNDSLDGGEGDDVLRGGAGDDRLEGGEGNDTIQGGSGNDTAVYAKAWTEYNVQRIGSSYFVEDRDTGDTDTLNSIEFMEFAGTSYVASVAVDDAPVAANDAGATAEDGTTQSVGNVLSNDSDADVATTPALGDALSVIGARTGTEGAGGSFQLPGALLNGTYGSLTINLDGSYTYDLANASAAVQSLKQGQTVTDTFSYRVADAKGLVDTAQLQITVTGTNDAPVVSGAVTLPAATSNTGTVIITAAQLLANSSDVDGDALSVVNLTASSGTLVNSGGGVWSFTPVANGPASVDFTYSVSDGIATTAATATLAVGDVNDAPIANDVTVASASEDAGVNQVFQPSELATDIDSTLTSASFNFTNATVNGNLVTLAVAGISYDTGTGLFSVNTASNALYQGLQVGETATVVANFTASDGSLSDAGTVTVQITGVNDAPVAVNDNGLVATESQTAIINPALLAANDTDVDGDTLTVVSVSNAVNGSVSYVNGYILFTPTTGYSGQASFDYTISDGTATSTATAFVEVTAVNDAPTAPATQTLDIDEDGTTGAVSIGASDLDGDTLAYSIASGDEPTFGSVSLDQTAGTFTYTPNADANGIDTFTITVSDGNGGTTEQVVTVNVAPVNDAPTAPATQTLDIDEDGTTGAISIGAADVDGDTLAYSIATGDEPTFGSVSFDQTAGTFTYTPNADANGTDTFTITVSDGDGGTTEQVVTVNVAAVNDAPTAPATQTLDIDEDGTTGAISIGAADVDGDTVAYGIASGDEPTFGSVSLDQTAGTFTYTPDADANGTDTFTITVSDGNGGTTEQVVTVNVAQVNDAPTAPATQTLDIDEDSTTGAISIGAADIDSSTLAYSIASGDEPTFGSVSFDQAAGTFTYTPDADANGTDTFTITVSDGDGGTTEQVVTVNVAPINDAPTDLALNNASVAENAANGTVVGTATPTDVDSTNFTFALLDNAGGRFAINNAGQITVADGTLLDFETATSHSIDVQVTDEGGLSYNETFVITIDDVVEGNSYIGTPGNDTAASPNDAPWTADGLAGNDDLTGGAGDDIINGGEDDDVLEGRAGADQINGGNGNDTARYALSSAAVTVNLLTAAAMGGDAEGDVLTSIENLIGSAFADTLTGDNQNNILTGGVGADTLVGNGGIDTASYAGSASGVTINLSSLVGGFAVGTGGDAEGDRLQGIENLVGSAFVDRLTGAATGSDISGGDGADILRSTGGVSVLRGGNGDDQLRGATANDTLIGGADNDTYFVVNSATQVVELLNEGTDTVSSSVTFTLSANVENLTLTGNGAINGTGNDENNTIFGNNAANTLRGGGGELDIIRGFGGNDILIGGAGEDRMNGGTGADTFVWETLADFGTSVASADQVQDFNRAEGDKFDLSLIDADTVMAGDQAFNFIGSAEFSGVAGQLRTFITTGNQLVVAGDTNGDSIADIFIRVSYTTDPNLLATDFIL